MVILNKSGRTLTEWSKITRIISIGNNGNDKREREKRGRNTCAVVAVYDGRESTVMGEYGSEEQCIRAIGKLYYAIQEGKTTFEFPQPEDLPVIKSHYGSGGGKSHGGS